MSPDDRTLVLLIERYLDGDLPPSGRSALLAAVRGDPAAEAALAAQLDLQRLLSDLHTGEDFSARTIRRMEALVDSRRQRTPSNTERLRRQPSHRRKARPAGIWLPVAACAVMAIVVALLWPAPDPLARVEQADGTLERHGRESPLARGDHLQAGDVLRSGAGGIVVRYADRTLIRLEPASSLGLDRGNGKSLSLSGGALTAEVTPQATGRPLRIGTPHGEATVIGTTFSLRVAVEHTRLAVQHGLVRLASGDAAYALEVPAGRVAIASVGSVRFESSPAAAAPAERSAVLMVRRAPTSDLELERRLRLRGLRIVARTDAEVTAADAAGVAAVLISEQVSATALGDRLRGVPVPLIIWECGAYVQMGLSAQGGSTTSGDLLTITQPGHPLAAGLGGTVSITAAARPLSTVPVLRLPPHNVIATVPGRHGPMAAIIAFERGSPLPDGTPAPARRVGLFLAGDLERHLLQPGWALVDAALDWCLATGPPP